MSGQGQGEVDEILLHFVKQFDEDIESIEELVKNEQQLYRVVVSCLRIIDESFLVNKSLPRNPAARVNICKQVVDHLVNNLGYTDTNASYSMLVYPNHADTSTLLLFLSQLVVARGGGPDETVAATDPVIESLKNSKNSVWGPPQVFKPAPLPCDFRAPPLLSVVKHAVQYSRSQLVPFPLDQQDATCSLLHQNALGVAQAEAAMTRDASQSRKRKGFLVGALRRAYAEADANMLLTRVVNHSGSSRMMTRFTRQRDQLDQQALVKRTGAKTEEEAQAEWEARVAAMEQEWAAVQQQAQELKAAIQALVTGKRALEAEAIEVAARAKQLAREKADIEMVAQLMQDPEGNKLKLQQLSQNNAAKLLQLGQQWEQKRVPMLKAYRAERDKFAKRKELASGKLAKIQAIRAHLRDMATQLSAKDEVYKGLVQQFKTLPKSMQRAVYTERILDIVKNVKKQNKDIEKVLVDTRDLQKEIATLTDSLSRSFAIVDEMIYADAPSDAQAKEAYKLLVAINERFRELEDGVSAASSMKNEAMEIERKIRTLQLRVDGMNLERVRKDIEMMRMENVKLTGGGDGQ